MSKYLLKITGSNDIVNIVEWNETGSLEAPLGYVFEPFVTGSTDFINYITDTTQSNLPSFYGEMGGYFTGELTGSIKYNGKTFEEFINETQYGSIGIISGSDINILNRPGYVSLISENNVILPISFADSGSSYNRALNRITDENISNYLLKFKLDQNTELQYLINQTVLTSSGELNYYNLDGVLQSTSSLNGNTFEEYFNISNTHGSPWHIDFDLGDKTHIGNFYGDFIGGTFKSLDGGEIEGILDLTGSMIVTGSINITGSLKLNNQTIAVEKTKYGKLAFNRGIGGEHSYYAPMEVNPPYSSFRFPTNPINWTTPVNRITMDGWNAVFITGDPDYGGTRYGYNPDDRIDMWVNYVNKMLDIINKGLTDTILTIRSVDWPNTYKQFKIKGGTYYVNDYQGSGNCARINWGDNITNWSSLNWNNLPPNNKMSDCSRFTLSQYQAENEIMWPDFYNYKEGDTLTNPVSYFDIDVVEVESNYEWYTQNVLFPSGISYYTEELPTVEPDNGYLDEGANDLFWIDFDEVSVEKRKEIHVIESSREFVVPSWVNTTKIYTVGAGGGGGGGTAGYKHYSGLPIIVDIISYKNYLPESFGHEILSGGGGGAGGNLAFKQFNKTQIPPGSVLTMIVGTGGKGGDGYGFANNGSEDTIRINTNILDPENYQDVIDNKELFHVFSNFLKIPKLYETFIEPGFSSKIGDGNYFRINKYQDKNDGKRGGFTSVILKSTPTNANVMTTLIQADGGLGGRCGIGIRSFIFQKEVLLNPTSYNGTTEIFTCSPCDQLYKVKQYWVPGGGPRIGNSSGYDTLYLGSPGGYGITMGTTQHDFDKRQSVDKYNPTRQGYAKIINKDLKRNTAPPQKWINNNSVFDLPDLKLPYGDTGVNRTDNETMEQSGYPSPTGGGGGAGKYMIAMENRLLSEEGNIDIRSQDSGFTPNSAAAKIVNKPSLAIINLNPNTSKGFPNNIFPDDYFKDLAIKINKATTLGLGGAFLSTNIFFDDGDSNGVQYVVKVGKGGNGGYDISHNPHSSVAGYTSTILPTNGGGDSTNGFGGGGGGGASVYTPNINFDNGNISTVGQNGGNGGNGVVVLVIES